MRLWLVMAFARFMRVPIDVHGKYFRTGLNHKSVFVVGHDGELHSFSQD